MKNALGLFNFFSGLQTNIDSDTNVKKYNSSLFLEIGNADIIFALLNGDLPTDTLPITVCRYSN